MRVYEKDGHRSNVNDVLASTDIHEGSDARDDEDLHRRNEVKWLLSQVVVVGSRVISTPPSSISVKLAFRRC